MARLVTYVFPVSHHYRYPFHVLLRDILAKHDIEYKVIYSAPFGESARRSDTVEVDWGHRVPLWRLGGLQYQHALKHVFESDLVIIQQENKLVINYICQILSQMGIKRVAFFGHGRNFQAENSNSLAERWKRFWAIKVDRWFGYTDETARHVESLGFPRERITVFNNSIDTSAIRNQMADIRESERLRIKSDLGIDSDNIGVYVGGMYREKRISFLIDSAKEVRRIVPDFNLLAIGGGHDAGIVEAAAREFDWIHYLGPKFGREKTLYVSTAKVFLMPGLVGLGVLDAFVYGTPIVTTDLPYHSPEIAYLEDGVNGVVVRQADSTFAYAEAVARVLMDDGYRGLLRSGGSISLNRYSIEAMASRFADGVLDALS